MIDLKIDIKNVVETEVVLLIPSMYVTGEPGDPLSDFVITVINNMIMLKYWPLDFGEDHGSHVELFFYLAESVSDAYKSSQHFISTGGDV